MFTDTVPRPIGVDPGGFQRRIGKGTRNTHLASLAGTMHRRNMAPEAIAAALLAENALVSDPPLPENEVRAIAQSIGSYAPARGVGLQAEDLADAVDVATEGQAIAAAGVPYIVDGIIPDYGMLGMSVAYTKVGKTSFAYSLGGTVCAGVEFIGRAVERRKVLAIAAEDRDRGVAR